MRPRKWSGLIIISLFATAVTVRALALDSTAPVDPEVSEEISPALPIPPPEIIGISASGIVTAEPTVAPDTDIISEGGTPTAIRTDGETTSIADAAEAVETVEGSAGILKWLHLLIVGLVPVAILGLKKVADRLPPHYLPMIAPLLGLAADAIGSLASGTTANPLVGALAGAAAVGVREVYDQWKKRNWARVTSPEVKP